jgi:alkyl hydroperoxide reductase subunit AhpC
MIHPNAGTTVTVRSLFIIDPNKKVRLVLTYPAETGRNFTELLRTIDSMQLTDKFKVATPVNWKQGEDVIITTAVVTKRLKRNSSRIGRRSSLIYASRSNRCDLMLGG